MPSGPTRSAPAATSRPWPSASSPARSRRSARVWDCRRRPSASPNAIDTMMLRTVLVALALLAQQIAGLPTRPDSVKFAVMGDMGTGDKPQYEVASQLSAAHARFPFDTVI